VLMLTSVADAQMMPPPWNLPVMLNATSAFGDASQHYTGAQENETALTNLKAAIVAINLALYPQYGDILGDIMTNEDNPMHSVWEQADEDESIGDAYYNLGIPFWNDGLAHWLSAKNNYDAHCAGSHDHWYVNYQVMPPMYTYECLCPGGTYASCADHSNGNWAEAVKEFGTALYSPPLLPEGECAIYYFYMAQGSYADAVDGWTVIRDWIMDNYPIA